MVDGRFLVRQEATFHTAIKREEKGREMQHT
jgi:hypothetical protein